MKEFKLRRLLLIWLAGFISASTEVILIKLYITKRNVPWSTVLLQIALIFIIIPCFIGVAFIIDRWATKRRKRKLEQN